MTNDKSNCNLCKKAFFFERSINTSLVKEFQKVVRKVNQIVDREYKKLSKKQGDLLNEMSLKFKQSFSSYPSLTSFLKENLEQLKKFSNPGNGQNLPECENINSINDLKSKNTLSKTDKLLKAYENECEIKSMAVPTPEPSFNEFAQKIDRLSKISACPEKGFQDHLIPNVERQKAVGRFVCPSSFKHIKTHEIESLNELEDPMLNVNSTNNKNIRKEQDQPVRPAPMFIRPLGSINHKGETQKQLPQSSHESVDFNPRDSNNNINQNEIDMLFLPLYKELGEPELKTRLNGIKNLFKNTANMLNNFRDENAYLRKRLSQHYKEKLKNKSNAI